MYTAICIQHRESEWEGHGEWDDTQVRVSAFFLIYAHADVPYLRNLRLARASLWHNYQGILDTHLTSRSESYPWQSQHPVRFHSLSRLNQCLNSTFSCLLKRCLSAESSDTMPGPSFPCTVRRAHPQWRRCALELKETGTTTRTHNRELRSVFCL